VVLIVVDTLRADHLGVYGYDDHPTSPNIDTWAERGLVFERAWATSSWTLPSFGSLLTGHLPTVHRAGLEAEASSGVPARVVPERSFATLSGSIPTLPGVLAEHGFRTGALVSNPLLDPVFGLDRGFADYLPHDTDNRTLRRAGETVDEALAWIDESADQPFFLLVHFFDPHMDYDAPAPYRGRFSDSSSFDLPVRGVWDIRNRIAEIGASERRFIAGAYDEEIAYVDTEIGRLLEELSRRPALDQALVMLTADHGEELFEHGGFEHGHAMFDEVLRVPLIVWGPAVEPGREAMPVSLLDVMPTVLHAAGVGDPNDTSEDSPLRGLPGVSLLDSARGSWPRQRVLVAERQLYGPEVKTIVRWPYKLILDVDADTSRMFDLSADAGERDDRSTALPDERAALRSALDEHLTSARALQVATGAEIDEDLLRRLRALGYIR